MQLEQNETSSKDIVTLRGKLLEIKLLFIIKPPHKLFQSVFNY